LSTYVRVPGVSWMISVICTEWKPWSRAMYGI
jgi:hypothetical protein